MGPATVTISLHSDTPLVNWDAYHCNGRDYYWQC